MPAPEESVDFDATGNLFIEGENLEVLRLLYKPYFGRVKMIYIDPPYNTGNDFVYPDDFKDPLDRYLRMTGQRGEAGEALTSNPETSGRYHSAWLSMMYPRLFLARQLLREDGVIFVSIDDHEVHNLRMLMNEIFGEENLVASVTWQHSIQPKGYIGQFSVQHNYVLVYQRGERFSLRQFERSEEDNRHYSNPDGDPRGRWRSGDVRNALYRPNLIYDLETPSGKTINPPAKGWRWSRQTMAQKIDSGEIIFSEDETRIIRKIYLADVPGRSPETIWPGKKFGTTREATAELKGLFDGESPLDTPKPTRVIRKMLELATDARGGDIILDFFAGSATTAQAVLELNREDGGNRRFILVQLPEPTGRDDYPTIAEIGKERIRRVIGRMNEEAEQGDFDLSERETPEDLGFKVFKLAPSNLRAWQSPPSDETNAEEYVGQLEMMADPLVDGWKPEELIVEVALRDGLGLNSRAERVEAVQNQEVWLVTDSEKDQRFHICLDEEVRLDALRPLGLGRDDLFICPDAALDDETAANLALQCRLRTL